MTRDAIPRWARGSRVEAVASGWVKESETRHE